MLEIQIFQMSCQKIISMHVKQGKLNLLLVTIIFCKIRQRITTENRLNVSLVSNKIYIGKIENVDTLLAHECIRNVMPKCSMPKLLT